MTPAEVLRVQLVALRERGANFDWAWRVALPVAVAHAQEAEDDEWAPILEGLRGMWRAGYERSDEHGTVEVVTAAAGRWCAWCGAALGQHRRSRARFCDSDCYNAKTRAERRERLGTPARCESCGGSMAGRRADTRACSIACARRLGRLARRAREGKPPPLTECAVCGGSLAHRTISAEVCGEACARERARQRYNERGPVAA